MSSVDKRTPKVRADLGIFAVIVSLAIFLRLLFFMGVLRGDDLGYYLLAQQLADNRLLPTYWGGQNRLGLYFPASVLIRIFGSSEFIAVLFPLLASILTLGFVYGIARLLGNKKAALISALIWAAFPLDVFLATQLMPDGPSVMEQTGAIFFLLLALRTRRRIVRLISPALSCLCVYWSLETKESNLIIVFPILAILLFEFFPKIKNTLLRVSKHDRARLLLGVLLVIAVAAIVLIGVVQPWPIVINNLELTSFDVSSLWLLGRNNPVGIEDVGMGYWVFDRPIYEMPKQLQALTLPTLGERIRVFDIFVPLFLVSAFSAIVHRAKKSCILLIWFFVTLFYLEWGTFTQTFYFPTVLIYLPVTHWIDPRNLHILSPPLVLTLGLFLSNWLGKSLSLRNTLIGAGMLVAFAIFSTSASSAVTERVFPILILLSVMGAAILIFLRSIPKPTRLAEIFAGGFLLILLAASQIPVPHFHVSDYFKEQARRANLREVLAFLDTQPGLPISSEGAAGWLDLYANFELGLDQLEQGLVSEKIAKDPTSLASTGGYRVLYGCDQPIGTFADWPLKEFGEDLGDKTCVSLVRVFATDTVEVELAQAKEAAEEQPSLDNIQLYLAAAMQSQNLAEASAALALFTTNFPEETPILQASQLLTEEGAKQLDEQAVNLLGQLMACTPNCNWSLSRLLTPTLVDDGGQSSLIISIDKKTDEVQTIKLPIILRSATAYVLHLEMRSFAPFDLVRFENELTPDSYGDSWNRATGWTSIDVVFVTPIWQEGSRQVELELARVYDRGQIEFRRIDLVELRVGQ